MKPKLLFIYDMPEKMVLYWKDGLWAALKLLEKDFEIERYNISDPNTMTRQSMSDDFVLGWGAFDSKVDKWLQKYYSYWKRGLCLGGHFPVNETAKNYDIIFYETEATRRWLELENLTKLKHAFGVNTDIFNELTLNKATDSTEYPKIWDNICVGSWSKWHRQDKLVGREGNNLAVGEFLRDDPQMSANLVLNCVLSGWFVSDIVTPEQLAIYYNMSKKALLLADFGQERAVLEARACGLEVEVSADNPKLTELLTSPIWDAQYYAQQLKEGILSTLMKQ